MIASRLLEFGKQNAIEVAPLELPPPAPNEVQLEMLASPINPADINIIEGTYGQLPSLPVIIGNEGAGRVVAVGVEVTNREVGQLVAPLELGSWCSHRNIAADRTIPLPPGTDPRQAAMLTVNPPTAFLMLRQFVTLKPGDWVVQNAANSGVGRCVIQIAKHLGLRTLNIVRRPELIEELRALGADQVVLEETDLKECARDLMGGASARLALNAVGGTSALNLANALENGGHHVTYGAMGRQPLKIPNGLVIFRGITFHGFWLRRWFRDTDLAEQQATFSRLAQMVKDGVLHVPVHATFPLTEIREALACAAGEKRSGKVLLDLNVA